MHGRPLVVVDNASTSLEALFERVSTHDRASFKELVILLDADLIRLAFAVAGQREVAEDAVQATWERLWHRPPAMKDPARIRSWLLKVAANEARHATRRGRRGRTLEATGASLAPAPDPGAREDEIDLHLALRRMSAAERELLALRYVLDLTSAEIAEHVNLSPEGVRTRLRRTLSKLREEMSHAGRA